MANFYTEHPELKFHLNNPMMERICQLKERDYRDKDEYDYAPLDYADAKLAKILFRGELSRSESMKKIGKTSWESECWC